jgi:hypothetical protein
MKRTKRSWAVLVALAGCAGNPEGDVESYRDALSERDDRAAAAATTGLVAATCNTTFLGCDPPTCGGFSLECVEEWLSECGALLDWHCGPRLHEGD